MTNSKNELTQLIELIKELNFDLDAMASAPFTFPVYPSGEVDWFAHPYDLFYFFPGLKHYFQGFKTETNPEGRHYFPEVTKLEFEQIPMFDLDTNTIHGKQMWSKDHFRGDFNLIH